MDTNKLKELAERATPGPWVVDAQQSGAIFNIESESGDLCIAMSQENPASTRLEMNEQRRVNAEFIAAANPQAILALLDEIDRLRSRLEIDERIPHDGISCRDETIKALDEKCDKLKAENDALRKFSAEAYQVLGALDAPENVLDNASDAANGVPLRHETLLPFFAEDYEALRKDAARYRWLIASAWYVGPEPKGDTEAVSWHDHNETMHGVTTAIDAALEGATQ
ncbi:ead/Ea22-like family protein [Pseudomonas aeruginosa]|uniref:ead/Ea22-like family protein n=1 Tax=Pseudomonas aeruginosa TaxID=287 RepID=UPI002A76346E|nr:ead/Ea22-like family protein [Pseudomonas aeruginosa]MDY1583330.1 ead/Ea22-like family protein [Pseudomonas aeruginosa]HCE5819522.1 ead/Ea22-like family protein [Pseudomonas aeruginosa]